MISPQLLQSEGGRAAAVRILVDGVETSGEASTKSARTIGPAGRGLASQTLQLELAQGCPSSIVIRHLAVHAPATCQEEHLWGAASALVRASSELFQQWLQQSTHHAERAWDRYWQSAKNWQQVQLNELTQDRLPSTGLSSSRPRGASGAAVSLGDGISAASLEAHLDQMLSLHSDLENKVAQSLRTMGSQVSSSMETISKSQQHVEALRGTVDSGNSFSQLLLVSVLSSATSMFVLYRCMVTRRRSHSSRRLLDD